MMQSMPQHKLHIQLVELQCLTAISPAMMMGVLAGKQRRCCSSSTSDHTTP